MLSLAEPDPTTLQGSVLVVPLAGGRLDEQTAALERAGITDFRTLLGAGDGGSGWTTSIAVVGGEDQHPHRQPVGVAPHVDEIEHLGAGQRQRTQGALAGHPGAHA